MPTKTQIATRTVQRLTQDKGAPESDDVTLAETTYDEAYQELLADSLVSWGADEEIPDVAAQPVISYLCGKLLAEFGVSGNHLAKLEMEAQRAPSALSRLLSPSFESEPVQATYY